MLQCVKTQVGQTGGIRVSKDSKYATLFVQLIEVNVSQFSFPGLRRLGNTRAAYFAIEIVSTIHRPVFIVGAALCGRPSLIINTL
jgi:hypothetical protein